MKFSVCERNVVFECWSDFLIVEFIVLVVFFVVSINVSLVMVICSEGG